MQKENIEPSQEQYSQQPSVQASPRRPPLQVLPSPLPPNARVGYLLTHPVAQQSGCMPTTSYHGTTRDIHLRNSPSPMPTHALLLHPQARPAGGAAPGAAGAAGNAAAAGASGTGAAVTGVKRPAAGPAAGAGAEAEANPKQAKPAAPAVVAQAAVVPTVAAAAAAGPGCSQPVPGDGAPRGGGSGGSGGDGGGGNGNGGGAGSGAKAGVASGGVGAKRKSWDSDGSDFMSPVAPSQRLLDIEAERSKADKAEAARRAKRARPTPAAGKPTRLRHSYVSCVAFQQWTSCRACVLVSVPLTSRHVQ